MEQHVLLHLHYFLILTTLSALGCPETQNNWVDQVTTILHILPSLLAHTQHSFDNILHPLRNILFYLANRLTSPLRRLLTSSRPSKLLCIFLNLIYRLSQRNTDDTVTPSPLTLLTPSATYSSTQTFPY